MCTFFYKKDVVDFENFYNFAEAKDFLTIYHEKNCINDNDRLFGSAIVGTVPEEL